jgi:class 3 adenylate cyclase/DNA-binding beta-propeller fold protein YncE
MQRARRESVLTTVLFTDIVGSSAIAAEMGDRRWRVLLSRHNALVRRQLRRFGGKELDTAGDGFFASFENPGNAIRCAAAVVQSVQELGIDVRTGLHLGQAEILGRKLGGAAVHIAARTVAQAGAAEVLVTGGLKDVLPSADFAFDDRGTHALKGVPGEWHLFRLSSLDQALPVPLEPTVAAERRAAVQAPPIWGRRYFPMAIAAAVVIAGVVAGTLLLGGGTSPKPAKGGLPAHALLLLDPQTGRVVATLAIGAPHPPPPPAPGGRWPGPAPRAVVAGEGSIWVTNGGDGSVLRVDPLRRVGRTIRVSGNPDDVTVGRGGVWVTSSDGTLTRIDPGTNVTTATDISEAAPVPMGLAVDDQEVVFVTALYCQIQSCPKGFQSVLARIDPSSGSVTTVRLPLYFPPSSVIATDGALWVTAGSEVWRVDRATGNVTARVRIEEELGDLAADPSGSSVWVTTVGSGGRVGRAIQIDASTGEIIGGQPIGCCPGAIAIGEGYVWVTNTADGTVQRISLTTGDVAPSITLGPVTSCTSRTCERGVNGIAVGQGGVWVTIDR